MKDLLGSINVVLHALVYCPVATLDNLCLVSQQDLLSSLWIMLAKDRETASRGPLALEPAIVCRFSEWLPLPELHLSHGRYVSCALFST